MSVGFLEFRLEIYVGSIMASSQQSLAINDTLTTSKKAAEENNNSKVINVNQKAKSLCENDDAMEWHEEEEEDESARVELALVGKIRTKRNIHAHALATMKNVWHFDRHVIFFSDIEGNGKPSDMILFELPVWI